MNDIGLFRWINEWPDAFAPFFVFLSEATKMPVGKVLFGVVGLVLLIHPKTRGATILAILALILANLTCDALKAGFQMLRPCVELQDVNLRVGKLTSFGTASAHSANMAALATVFLSRVRPLGYFWLAVAFFTGLSRIYVGVHYPYQVALGWTVGAFSAYLLLETWNAWGRIKETRQSAKELTDRQ